MKALLLNAKWLMEPDGLARAELTQISTGRFTRQGQRGRHSAARGNDGAQGATPLRIITSIPTTMCSSPLLELLARLTLPLAFYPRSLANLFGAGRRRQAYRSNFRTSKNYLDANSIAGLRRAKLMPDPTGWISWISIFFQGKR